MNWSYLTISVVFLTTLSCIHGKSSSRSSNREQVHLNVGVGSSAGGLGLAGDTEVSAWKIKMKCELQSGSGILIFEKVTLPVPKETFPPLYVDDTCKFNLTSLTLNGAELNRFPELKDTEIDKETNVSDDSNILFTNTAQDRGVLITATEKLNKPLKLAEKITYSHIQTLKGDDLAFAIANVGLTVSFSGLEIPQFNKPVQAGYKIATGKKQYQLSLECKKPISGNECGKISVANLEYTLANISKPTHENLAKAFQSSCQVLTKEQTLDSGKCGKFTVSEISGNKVYTSYLQKPTGTEQLYLILRASLGTKYSYSYHPVIFNE